MKRLCVLFACLAATLATKGICRQGEDVRYMGIDVVAKITKRTTGSDTPCQGLRTTIESAYTEDENEDDGATGTEQPDDLSEEYEYDENDESFLTGFVIGSTYHTIVGGGLSVTFGFTGCPTVKAISEHVKGRHVYVRLSSDAPWRDTNPVSMNRTEALALLDTCEVSVDIKCSRVNVTETTYGTAALVPRITQATRRSHIIGSTLADTECVKSLDITVQVGEMCKRTSDLSARDSLKVKNGKLLEDDILVLRTPTLKACN
ncbi:M-T1 [Myxoma virus]|uniref:M-T1 n=1 Tax=Myxoma virus TaxID=10273 RepID=A0A481NA48_9POXV|nr:m1 [Myxoma virus]QAV37520.1 M-T1 [Myxoma virus]